MAIRGSCDWRTRLTADRLKKKCSRLTRRTNARLTASEIGGGGGGNLETHAARRRKVYNEKEDSEPELHTIERERRGSTK